MGETIEISKYPYKSEPGNVTVIGPECFASEDESVIFWKGEHYSRSTDLPPSDVPFGEHPWDDK